MAFLVLVFCSVPGLGCFLGFICGQNELAVWSRNFCPVGGFSVTPKPGRPLARWPRNIIRSVVCGDPQGCGRRGEGVRQSLISGGIFFTAEICSATSRFAEASNLEEKIFSSLRLLSTFFLRYFWMPGMRNIIALKISAPDDFPPRDCGKTKLRF